MEENTWDAAAPAPLSETIDTLPEGASEALAKLDSGPPGHWMM
jgi:hypothetical protein